MKKILAVLSVALFLALEAFSQAIPQNIQYTNIYDLIDELANESIIDINSTTKPYNRNFIAQKLIEATSKQHLLNSRQIDEIEFYKNDYALELDTIAHSIVRFSDKKTFAFTLLPPAFSYNNGLLKGRIMPILGMNLLANKKGVIREQKWGAEIQITIADHLSVWGSMQEHKFVGTNLLNSIGNKQIGSLLYPSKSVGQHVFGHNIDFLYNHMGYQYDLNNRHGADFTESRGGIVAYTSWGSVGLVKDNIVWGSGYNGSIIFSGRVPSFPMITLNLKPSSWFELNYIHGFLVSNVADSTHFYSEKENDNAIVKRYRYKNKFIAANLMTFSPVPKLNISIGNSIIYAEQSVNAAYFIPIAFYKALDKIQTRGLRAENQNSQIFLDFSSRNIKHLHIYASIFFDEVKFGRFLPKSKERNPMSYKVGFMLTNFPIKNLSLNTEFTRTNIIAYKHSVEELTFESNSIGLGHYLGDNSQDIFVSIGYKPIRGLNIKLSYNNATKYNDYSYVRSSILQTISQKSFENKVSTNSIIALNIGYEIFNNIYAFVNMQYNEAKGYDRSMASITTGETPMTAEQNLNKFYPKFYQDKNFTTTLGLTFGF